MQKNKKIDTKIQTKKVGREWMAFRDSQPIYAYGKTADKATKKLEHQEYAEKQSK